MPKRKNRRRKPKRVNWSNLGLKIKTFLISMSLGALAAMGLWKCLDEDSGAILKPFEEQKTEIQVDVGKGQTPDPTLVNEQELLKEEASILTEMPEPEIELEPEEEDTEKEEDEEELEEKFPNFAVAFHFHTQIFGNADPGARVVGYARRGAKFKVSERVSTKGCAKGWHELLPGGTFICNGKGVIVSDEPVDFSPSPRPVSSDASMPYDYVYVTTDNTPQYWRIPTPEEVISVSSLFERIASRLAPPEKGESDSDSLNKAIENAKEIAEAAAANASESDGGVEATSIPAVSEEEKGEEISAESVKEETDSDGGASDPYALPPFVYQRMNRGYYVSVDGTTSSESGDYLRTIRGRYIPRDKLAPAKPSTFEGLLTKGQNELPIVFNVGGGVKLLKQEEEGGALKSDAAIARLSHFPFFGNFTRKGRRYVQVGEDIFLTSRVSAVAHKVEPPEDLVPGERWINVDLSNQVLVAYEGEVPVFATLVSTGKEGFETPEGTFRIYSKHVSITMDDPNGGEEAYSIEDVPWNQYFEDSYALHAAFWHNRFGRVRSHGCINLAPADARRLFFWTGPHLPPGFHGIASTKDNPGTRVVIHK